jgi:hypothetical protein
LLDIFPQENRGSRLRQGIADREALSTTFANSVWNLAAGFHVAHRADGGLHGRRSSPDERGARALEKSVFQCFPAAVKNIL